MKFVEKGDISNQHDAKMMQGCFMIDMSWNKEHRWRRISLKRIISISIFFVLLISIYQYTQAVENNPAKVAKMRGIGLGAYCSTVFDSLPTFSELDTWTGQYIFSETFPHNSGEINYFVDYEIIIYKDDGRYYAELGGNGWFLQTRSLAYIEGSENSIDIIFKGTLPGDSLYGRVERYEADELILTLSYDGSELISTWHALRREHPVLIECEEEIKGNYFKKKA